jgi:kinetochore protein NDC80
MDHHALAFSYFEHAYEMWLDQYDEFAEANDELESRYGEFVLHSKVLSVIMY